MASARELSCNPNWAKTDEVPFLTRRTARSAIPSVFDLCGLDPSWSMMISDHLRASSNEFQRIVRNTWSSVLCVSWAEFVLHGELWIHCVAKSCTTTEYLWCNLDSCSSSRTLWSAVIISPNLSATFILTARSSKFIVHGALVTFVPLHTSQFGSLGKWVNKLCLPPTLLEVSFAGGCAERGIAGGGTATSLGDTSIEHEDSLC